MAFVLDASVTLGWCFHDERQDLSDIVTDLLDADNKASVPQLWWFEIRHAALAGLRQKRVTAQHVQKFFVDVGNAAIVIMPLPDGNVVFNLAQRHRLSFYEAAYLELAQREGIALATLDNALVRAAMAEGVPLIAA